jgi:DNA-binding phage protein
MKPKAKVTTSTFHVSDYPDHEKLVAAYLTSAAQDENPDVLLTALGDVAKARGMAQVAKGLRARPRMPVQGAEPRSQAEV